MQLTEGAKPPTQDSGPGEGPSKDLHYTKTHAFREQHTALRGMLATGPEHFIYTSLRSSSASTPRELCSTLISIPTAGPGRCSLHLCFLRTWRHVADLVRACHTVYCRPVELRTFNDDSRHRFSPCLQINLPGEMLAPTPECLTTRDTHIHTRAREASANNRRLKTKRILRGMHSDTTWSRQRETPDAQIMRWAQRELEPVISTTGWFHTTRSTSCHMDLAVHRSC